MYHSNIPKFRALREEYVRKYNENYTCCLFGSTLDPDQPAPTYNPDFWNRNRLCKPYSKYDLAAHQHYTIDKIVVACNRYTNIPENERKRDIDCLVYHNINRLFKRPNDRWVPPYPYSKTFEEYKQYLEELNVFPEVLGAKRRRQLLYLYIIKQIEHIINSACKNVIDMPENSRQAIARPM